MPTHPNCHFVFILLQQPFLYLERHSLSQDSSKYKAESRSYKDEWCDQTYTELPRAVHVRTTKIQKARNLKWANRSLSCKTRVQE